MSTRYKVVAIDLTAARTDPERLIKLGLDIHNVVIVTMPGGAPSVSIRFGDGSNGLIPLNAFPVGTQFKPGTPEKDGLFVVNAAGAFTVLLLVSFEDGPLGVTV